MNDPKCPEAYPLLQTIDDPSDLRALSVERLAEVAEELRAFLLACVSQSGGHLSAGLGAVELTLALHYALDTPHDRLIWDVGHQCYAHKALTGRRRWLTEIRQAGGPAGFPVREESDYDAFGVGHSSTSISAALGMVLGSAHSGTRRRCVAVIGDGGLTAGEAFEALNHAGGSGADLLVVLNDNEMSISENVGALSNYLTRLLSAPLTGQLRRGAREVLRRVPPVHEFARRTEEHLKGMIAPGTLFEELGFHYYGPVDGHDASGLVTVLRNLRDQPGPRLLHVVTRKGKGYAPAEQDPTAYHGVGRFDPARGLTPPSSPGALSYTDVFDRWITQAAVADRRLFAITPAMREGSGLGRFAQRYPERFIDVGIAEQHAVTLAAGLACEGARPVVAMYSTFLQRGYDQLIHDVALQRLPVLFAIDRAGIVGPDGATHQGTFDLSFLRCVPELIVMTPGDEAECWRLLSTGLHADAPAAVRYPRGRGPGCALPKSLAPLPIGQAEIRRRGDAGIALLVFGALLPTAEAVAEELDLTVANMRFVKPLDVACIEQLAATHRHLLTLEENVIAGGAGSAVSEHLARIGNRTPVTHLGLPDTFTPHGDRDALLAASGLDAAGLRSVVASLQQPG
ncbi:1-deoxy-D-xylulose-5-phosphate synthase [Halorhodospira abdelmalekii]|nr:1-deoxy-D-xylulose-5-phosphate synthase [Halorhodospira abdelmalekii]